MNEQASFRAALVYRLVAGMGVASALASAACGDTVEGTGGAGGTGGSGTTTSSGTTASSSSGSTSSSTSASSTSSSSSSSGTTTSSSSSSSGGVENERCFQQTGATCPDIAAASGTYTCTEQSEPILKWISGPTVQGTTCCYVVEIGQPFDPPCGAIPGRPFVVEGRARIAPVGAGVHGWAARASEPAPVAASRPPMGALSPDVAALDDATRAAVGRAWAMDAAFEHASVASFGKLALELLAFGAPADLVRATHEAALDEIRHAEMCFTLSGRYLGALVGPGTLLEARSFMGAATLADLAAATVREGCVGETLAAVVASVQHTDATDPAVRAALAIIAEEESRHAELAFRVVAWAIAAGGEDVRHAVHQAFLDALDDTRRAAEGAGGVASSAPMRAHGRLSDREVHIERLRAAEEVVVPAMAHLLGAQAS
ncbi:Hypothetical protein A7982_02288 [Minicystis rosea]|nr:Hypothetical protein A7982_02288 [Minicystis rosea]